MVDSLTIEAERERALSTRRQHANDRLAACIALWLITQFCALALPCGSPRGVVLSAAWFLVLGTSGACGVYTLSNWSVLTWRSRLAGLSPCFVLVAILTLFAWLWVFHPGPTRNMIFR